MQIIDIISIIFYQMDAHSYFYLLPIINLTDKKIKNKYTRFCQFFFNQIQLRTFITERRKFYR